MKSMLAMESRKPAVLGALPRRPAFDSTSFNRRNVAAIDHLRTPMLGHHFSNVAITSGNRSVLYEENLEGQPGPEAGVADDASQALPLDTSSTTGSATGGTQTGETGCDTATGKAFSNTLNTNDCTKDCSTKHEAKHAVDIGPCCVKAGTAAKAAKTDAEKADVQKKFDDWMIANRPFLECRAYDVSVSCGETKHKQAKCEEHPNGKCCKALVWYIRTSMTERTAACNHADKNLSECPFL
jgi:hypothetical protein